MNPFFTDVMNSPEINWGQFPLTLRTTVRVKKDGYMAEPVIKDIVFSRVSSPQLLDPQEVRMKGWGEYSDGEVYECFLLTELRLNDMPADYRTIIFNNREYELLKCSPFGVNRGTSSFDGYYDLYFGRKANSQGGNQDVVQ